jgi:hypothetical protein
MSALPDYEALNLPGLPDLVALHRQPPSRRVAAGERSGAGRMQARLAKRPDMLDKRRETVEHPQSSNG